MVYIEILANQYTIQVYEWSVRWQLKFNISKCKHMHFGPSHSYGLYSLNGTTIDSVESQKDLVFFLTTNLSFINTPQILPLKPIACLLGLIKRSFDHLDSDILTKLFVGIVCPTLEYCNSVWGPSFILDQRKIEQVQRRATNC